MSNINKSVEDMGEGFVDRLKKALLSHNIKSVFQLAAGSFLAQVIVVAASPISTRLYTAEQLGIYTLLLTLVSVFGPVICGKYDAAIVTAEDEREAAELIVGSITFLMIFILIIFGGYSIYLHYNSEILKELGAFSYTIIGILVATGFINILNSYNNRCKEYKTIASVNVIRTAAQNIGMIGFGLFKAGSIGLLLAQFFGSLIGLRRQGKLLLSRKIMFREIEINKVKGAMNKYKKQPLFSMPAHFINSASYSLVNFFISGLYGMKYFGYYALAYRILGLPLSLISMNVSYVFFRKASEEKLQKGNYFYTLRQLTIFLACISVCIVIVLAAFGPKLFTLVFGIGWKMAGDFARIMAPMYGFRFVVAALTPALIISGEQKLELIIQSLFILSSLCAYFISRFFGGGIYTFITLITITYSVIYTVFYFIIYRLSAKGDNVYD